VGVIGLTTRFLLTGQTQNIGFQDKTVAIDRMKTQQQLVSS
jgi:hypothetical protein